MNQRRIRLLRDEEIIFEGGPAVLTNQRLLAEVAGAKEPVEAKLAELASFRKMNGGQQSRTRAGVQSMAGGVGVMVLGTLVRQSSQLLETVFFLVGAMALLVGTYFVLSSMLRVKPNTTVFFRTRDFDDIAISFPGWDNPEAEELTRNFVRAKRGL